MRAATAKIGRRTASPAKLGRRASRLARLAAGALLFLVTAAAPAAAADVTVAPGGTLTLTDDIVLTGGDLFTAGGDTGGRCAIHGGGHVIRTGDTAWSGTFTMKNCDVDGLGVALGNGIELYGTGQAAIVMQGNTFSKSSEVFLSAADTTTVTFQRNTLGADSLVPAVKILLETQPCFAALGNSTGTKVFQGNRIRKSYATFRSSGWLIGGDNPGDGNIFVGTRTGMYIQDSSDLVIRGNYAHPLVEGDMWNQVKNLSILHGTNIVVEHNVFRARNWLAELNATVDFRYNLLLDAYERGWVLVWDDVAAKVHHNVLVGTKQNQNNPAGAFVVEINDPNNPPPPTTEVYNNTVDAGGVCTPASGGGVIMHDVAGLTSLRSNAFTGIRQTTDPRLWVGMTMAPSVMSNQPFPIRLGYADYNLFYNPDSPSKVNYAAGVADKTMRTDSGFGYHDIPVGGQANMQVDPKFAGRIPRDLPYSEDDLLSGATTPAHILAYYRQVYAPAPGSPLIDSGDPQEGPGNDIGAVGAGAPNDLDKFGTLGDPSDIGHPTLNDNVYSCTHVALAPGVLPPGGGITCVCNLQSGRTSSRDLALALGMAIPIVVHRRRRRR